MSRSVRTFGRGPGAVRTDEWANDLRTTPLDENEAALAIMRYAGDSDARCAYGAAFCQEGDHRTVIEKP